MDLFALMGVLIEKEIVKDQKRKRKRKPAAAPNASGYFQDNIQVLKENKAESSRSIILSWFQ